MTVIEQLLEWPKGMVDRKVIPENPFGERKYKTEIYYFSSKSEEELLQKIKEKERFGFVVYDPHGEGDKVYWKLNTGDYVVCMIFLKIIIQDGIRFDSN